VSSITSVLIPRSARSASRSGTSWRLAQRSRRRSFDCFCARSSALALPASHRCAASPMSR